MVLPGAALAAVVPEPPAPVVLAPVDKGAVVGAGVPGLFFGHSFEFSFLINAPPAWQVASSDSVESSHTTLTDFAPVAGASKTARRALDKPAVEQQLELCSSKNTLSMSAALLFKEAASEFPAFVVDFASASRNCAETKRACSCAKVRGERAGCACDTPDCHEQLQRAVVSCSLRAPVAAAAEAGLQLGVSAATPPLASEAANAFCTTSHNCDLSCELEVLAVASQPASEPSEEHRLILI